MHIEPYNILLKPLVSEKSNLLREGHNQVVFKVAQDANKQTIKAPSVSIIKSIVVSKIYNLVKII